MATSMEGAQRAAVAALCANGGFAIALRMPGLAASGSEAEQLGLATPQFDDVPLGPAAWRKAGSTKGLIVGAPAVQSVMGLQGYDSARALFQAAIGVVVDGVFYTVAACEPLMVAGEPCAYRLTLQEPSWN